jgi:SNF2 family DNA or RNA helicase
MASEYSTRQPGYDVVIDDLDASSPRAQQPADIKIQLKQHQLTLLQRCHEFESGAMELSKFSSLQRLQPHATDHVRTRIGILADKVGSGKSYVILSLLVSGAPRAAEPNIRTYGCNKVVLSQINDTHSLHTNLLVIPHNLASQWDGYIRAFTGALKTYMVNSQRTLGAVCSEVAGVRASIDIRDYDLVVVTSSFYNRLAYVLSSQSYKLRRIIFDEVDNINIPGCQELESDFYWFVTASYGNLLYPRGYSRWDPIRRQYVHCAVGLRNSGFIRTLFTDLHSNISNDYTKILVVRNKDSYVQESIHLPEIQNVYVKCRTPPTISVLHGLVDKSIIECLNAGDVSSALQHINPQHRKSEDSIVGMLIERYARQIKNIEVRLEYTQHYEYENEQDKQAELERLTVKRQEMETKMQSIKDRIQASDMCSICYDGIQNKTIVPCCSNAYCFQCISMWLCRNVSCPLCKGTIGIQGVYVVDRQKALDDGASTSSHQAADATPDHSHTLHESNDKIKNLENILRGLEPNAKVLLFSSYENTFANVQTVLHDLQMPYAYLKGNMGQVKNIVERYKTGDLNVLLVNARQYGAGLNLENTQHLIMFHKFDNEIERQIIGRAHRYGRDEPLKLWYLLHENEMVDT